MLTQSTVARDRIELAHSAPFDLGDVRVLPAVRQLSRRGASETLEPRVMQVLVALARAEGAVVTRDELIDLCWEGRIVSESAINRVISRVRQTASCFAAGAFQVETITKVGYRLVVLSPEAGQEREPPLHPSPVQRHEAKGAAGNGLSRRALLGGLSAVGLVAAVVGVSRSGLVGSERSSSTAATEYYRKGAEARAHGDAKKVGQAEVYFAQAVEADPHYAAAWSALALARAGQLNWEQGADQDMLAAKARFAADRALRIDPQSAEAKIALSFIPSMFARWADAEADYRRLLKEPDLTPFGEWVLRSRLSSCLASVGRCKDALREFRTAARIFPDHPYTNVGLTQALWNAGDVAGARAESDRALLRFPQHSDVWFTRMALLTYGPRPEEAVAFGRDPLHLPFRETGEGLIFRRLLTARALAELTPELVEDAARHHLASVAADWDQIPAAARFFAALGRMDEVFALLRGYFLNEGTYADPQRPRGPLTRYAASNLFWPPMKPAWTDPRFPDLAAGIGLQDYWRKTGTGPDFRTA